MISVLYVDDEPSFLELTRTFLELQGDILVDGAPSALEAIEMMKHHDYDAVVSDFQMPGMDGLRFLSHVRNRHGDLPFILFTGKGREEVVIQALNGGADFYLQKGGEAKAQFAELAHKVRQAVERRKKSDALNLAEFSVDQAAVMTIWTDDVGRIIKANRATALHSGYGQSELLKMNLGDLDPSMTPETHRRFWGELETNRQLIQESNLRRKDGSVVPVQLTANYLEMNGKKYNFAFGWDITESKRAERALRESEERFRTLVESANSIILKVDAKGCITYVNEFALRYFGYSNEELIDKCVMGTLIPTFDSQGMDQSELFSKISADVRRYGVIENENVLRDGRRVWISWTNTALYDQDGKLKEILSIGNDITELKKIERDLRLSQARLMQAQGLGRLGDFHYELSHDGSVLNAIWSNEVYRLLGLEPGTRPPDLKAIGDHVHSEDWKKWNDAVDATIQGGGRTSLEHRLLLEGGEVLYVQVAFEAARKANGDLRFVGIVQDITELKRVEEALRTSEQRYRMLADLVPDYMFVVDARGMVRYVNSGMIREAGRDASKLLGRSIDDLFPPKFAQRQRENLAQVIETKEPMRVEIRHDEDGTVRWMDVALVPVKDDKGTVTEVIGTSREITRIKKVEEELWETATSYRVLTENLPGLVYRVHLRDNERMQFFNEMLLPLTGYEIQEFAKGEVRYLDHLIEPEDRAMVLNVVREAVDLDRTFDVEYRMRRKDGIIIHVSERGKPIRGSDGSPLYIDGVMLDITQRKHTEVAMRESERKFRELADMLPALVFETNETGRLTFINETARAMVGFGREDLGSDMRLFDLLAPTDQQRAKEQFEKLGTGETCIGEVFDLMHRDGSRFPATLHCVAVIQEGTLKGMRGLFVDISALRESEMIQEATHRISEATMSHETLDELYQSIHGIMRELMPLENFYIALYDEEKDELSFPYFVDQRDPRPIIRRKGRGMTEYVLRTGEPLLVTSDGIERLKAMGDLEIIGTPPMDFMAVPLMVDGRVIGLMAAQSYDPKTRFGQKNMEIMRFVSHQVAMAIRRKRQEVELKRYVGLLRTTFESTDDGILIVGIDGKILTSNDRFTKMWCIPDTIMRTKDDERMLGFVLDQLKNPEAFLDRVKYLYTDRALTSFDRIEFKDGRFFERYSQPFYLGESIAGRIWSFRDVTERTLAEEALHKSERELKSIVNSAKDAIFVKDMEGRYIIVNEAMGALFQVPVVELTGTTDRELFGADIAEANDRTDRAVLLGKTMEEEVVWRITGNMHTFSVVKVPLKDDEGCVVGICGIARDTTERKKVERALKDANESLNLLSSITRHDVLNQLMVIRGYSDLVRAALKDHKLLDYMDKVERATRNIRSQILFTRDFQRLGVAEPKWQSVEEMLDKALTNLEVGKIDISVDLGGLELLADPMLEKVFYNFLDNTLRHGEKATRIAASCQRRGDELLLIYEDDGVGVRSDDKEHIFDRGFGKNTGLGLFLVRLILKVTGIQVAEVGEEGKGVRFEMIIPDGTYRFREWDDSEH